MKFSGKMSFNIRLQLIKNQCFILSLEDTFFKKAQGGGQIAPPPSHPAVL